jgi:hypothetical protein
MALLKFRYQREATPMTSLILESKEQILKEKPIYWANFIEGLWQQKKDLNPIYLKDQDHGINCKCCTRIVRESSTCPTKEERNKPKQRGRPKLRRGGSEI